MQLIAYRQQLAIAWCQVIEDRARSLPEGVGIKPRAGQRAFLDKARQGCRHLQSKPFSVIHRRHHVRSRSGRRRSEEHTSELQSLMRISYAVFCLKKKKSLKQIYKHI